MRNRNADGFILVAVLWIIAALATLATIFSVYVINSATAFTVHDERLQAEGCAPLVKAWNEKSDTTTLWENPVTNAPGLRVPGPFAGRQMLKIMRDTGGHARAVSEREIVDAQKLLGRVEGIWAAPEAAAGGFWASEG